MLGDCSIEKPSPTSNSRLQFKQSTKNKVYIEHLFSIFKEFCGTDPKIMSKFDSRPNKNKIYEAIKFQTFSLPCFNKYKDIFYNNGVKIVPLNLEELLTARGLAFWLMDDGYSSVSGFYICTESFSIEDLDLIVKVLQTNFNLKSTYHKTTNGNRIYIHSTSKKDLINLVKPYFIPHFYYKLEGSTLEEK